MEPREPATLDSEASLTPGGPVMFLCLSRVFFVCCSELGCGELKYGPVVEGFLVSCLLTSFHFTAVLLTKPLLFIVSEPHSVQGKALVFTEDRAVC